MKPLVHHSWIVLLVVAALLTGCADSSGVEASPALTGADLASLIPSTEEVGAALDVSEVEMRESDGLTQAFEGLELPDGLESYGQAYTSGDPNSGEDWSAVGLSLVIAPSESDAERLLGELTVASGWEDADVGGVDAAQTQHFGPVDGFTGDRLVARAGTLLVSLDVLGSQDIPRAEAAQSLVEGVLERAGSADK